MNEPLTFLHDYCDFSDPQWVWMLKGVSRNKDNDNSGVKFMRRLVIRKPEELETCRQEMHNLMTDPDTFYRIYISLNSRNVVKGLFEFQKKMIDIGQGLARGLDDHLWMSKKVHSLWKTELEQRSCRGTKRILLDVDNEPTEDNALAIVAFLNQHVKTKVHVMRKTVSGWAIVFDACDTRELMRLCEKEWKIEADLQRDSMVFVEQWRGNNLSKKGMVQDDSGNWMTEEEYHSLYA